MAALFFGAKCSNFHFERLTLSGLCLRRVLMNNLVKRSSFISRLSVYMNDETSSHAKEMTQKDLF